MRKLLVFFLVLGFASAAHALPGDLDTSFSTDGKVITDVPGNGRANAVAIQDDGKIVAVGDAAGDFAVVRYNSNGSLDTSFGGGDGIVTTDFGSSTDRAQAIAYRPTATSSSPARPAPGPAPSWRSPATTPTGR